MIDLLEEYREILHEPPAQVYCYTCRNHIYDIDEVPLGRTELTASLFKPARPDIKAPVPGQQVACPICGGQFITPEGELLTKDKK